MCLVNCCNFLKNLSINYNLHGTNTSFGDSENHMKIISLNFLFHHVADLKLYLKNFHNQLQKIYAAWQFKLKGFMAACILDLSKGEKT